MKAPGQLFEVPRLPAHEEPQRFTILSEFKLLVGELAVQKLIDKFGGSRLYIPQTPIPGDHLVRAVGITAAVKLARIFGGERVMIPADLQRSLRRDRIVALRACGASIPAIARSLRVTERYVYKVLADTKSNSAGSTDYIRCNSK